MHDPLEQVLGVTYPRLPVTANAANGNATRIMNVSTMIVIFGTPGGRRYTQCRPADVTRYGRPNVTVPAGATHPG